MPEETKKTLLSQSEFARLKGVPPSALVGWKARGLLVMEGKKVWVEGTNDLLTNKRRKGQAPKLARTQTDANTAKIEADVKLRELRYDQLSGKVVEAEAAAKAVASRFAIVRNHMLGLGSKIAPQVVPLTDAMEIKALIDAEVAEALEALSNNDEPGSPEWDADDDGQEPDADASEAA